MMKDSTAADTSTSNDYHDDFDSTDTRAFWRKEDVSRFTALPPGGQSRWSFCVLGVSAVVLLILIISISVTKVQVDRKLSAVERDISNLTQNLLSITSRIQQLDKNGEAVQQKLSEMLQNLNALQVQAQDNTQDDCCPLDWTPFSSHCYYFSDYGMSWHQARDKCDSMKAELLILKSKEEKEFVVQRTMPHYYWLGLSDERTGQWEWLDGTPYVMVRSVEFSSVTLAGRRLDLSQMVKQQEVMQRVAGVKGVPGGVSHSGPVMRRALYSTSCQPQWSCCSTL
ncbi:hypothetical protein AOLI_G00152520 [Acnodon oligacanthus]